MTTKIFPVDRDGNIKVFRATITGATGSGKSVAGEACAEELLRNGVQFVVFDPKHDNMRGLAKLRMVESIEYKPDKDGVININEKKILKLLNDGYSIVFYPSLNCSSAAIKKIEERLCLLIFEKTQKRFIVIILDEAHRHLRMNAETEIFVRVAKEGRSIKKGFIAITQRVNMFSKEFLGQCERYFIFRLNTELDKKYIGAEMDGIYEALKGGEIGKYECLMVKLDDYELIILEPFKTVSPHFA